MYNKVLPYFSGRLDMYCEEEDIFDMWAALIDKFECYDCLLTFEDETKSGLPCKPHYHFIFRSEGKHDTIRKWISKEYPELKGTRCSLTYRDNPDEPIDKGIIYTLKQYKKHCYVAWSDFDEDELNEFISLSNIYNQYLNTNSWQEHLELIIKQCEALEINDRYNITYTIGSYIYDWNAKAEHNKLVKPPANLNQVIEYIECRILPKNAFMARYMSNHSYDISSYDISESDNALISRMQQQNSYLKSHSLNCKRNLD